MAIVRNARELGKFMRQSRESSGMTQSELARAMRTCRTHISKLENGRDTPTLKTINKFATALGYNLQMDLVIAEKIKKRS